MIRELPPDLEPGEAEWFQSAAGVRCPPVALLTGSMAGVVPEPLATRVREHAAACAACRVVADAFAEGGSDSPTSEQADRIRRRVTVAARRPFPFSSIGHAAAAALILAAGVAILVRGWSLVSPIELPAGPPETRTGDRELPTPAYVLALQKPAVVLPERALISRGRAADPYVNGLRDGLDSYRREDFAEAARKLHAVAQSFPGRPHAAFYEGASLLLAGRAADALLPLENARKSAAADPWLADESAWYLAVALERSGQRESAARVLSSLCSAGRARRNDACRGVRDLSQGSGADDRGGQSAARADDRDRRDPLTRSERAGGARRPAAGD